MEQSPTCKKKSNGTTCCGSWPLKGVFIGATPMGVIKLTVLLLAPVVIIPLALWLAVFINSIEKVELPLGFNNSSAVMDDVILPNGTWTLARVSNKSNTYYMLAESKDGRKKFYRNKCKSICEKSGEGSKLGALTNEVERLSFLKIRKDLDFPEGFYWVDARRVKKYHQKSKPAHLPSKMKPDTIIGRDYRSRWYWKGDASLPIGQEDKWWFSDNYPQYPGRIVSFSPSGRVAKNFGAYMVGNDTSGIANDRYADDKNGCLCEFRIQNE